MKHCLFEPFGVDRKIIMKKGDELCDEVKVKHNSRERDCPAFEERKRRASRRSSGLGYAVWALKP